MHWVHLLIRGELYPVHDLRERERLQLEMRRRIKMTDPGTMVYSEVCNVTYVMSCVSRLSCVKCRVRKASGVSLKRASKMQLRGVDLRSVRHSSQKLWPVMDFLNFAICKSFVYVRGSSSKGNKDIWPKALFSLLIREQNFAEKCSDT